MRGRINGVKRFEIHDGEGIRTTLFMKGCPLNCLWCHNPENISPVKQLYFLENKCALCKKCQAVCPLHSFKNDKHAIDRKNCKTCGECVHGCPVGALGIYGQDVTVEEILPVFLEDRDYYTPGGATVSGGEPLMQAEFCEALLRALKGEGIHTAVDTCLYATPEDLKKIVPFTDIFLVDIKAMDGDVHKKLTGKDNALILQNFEYLHRIHKAVEVRIPYVPQCNDAQMPKIAQFLTQFDNVTGVKILPYHDFYKGKSLSLGKTNVLQIEKPSSSVINDVKNLFKSMGLNVLEN